MSGKFSQYKIANGLCLYSKGVISEEEVMLKYYYSNYELDKFPPSEFLKKSYRHYDKIQNIPNIDESTKQYLLKEFSPKEGECVIDLGAYRGFGTLKLSEMVGKNGLVIAIEGDKENFEILKMNINRNQIGNVKMFNKIVSDQIKETFFYIGKGMGKSLTRKLVGKASKKIKIQTDTVDNILLKLGNQKIDFISLQVNQAEVKALLGMKKLLSKKGLLRIVSAGWYPKKGEKSCYRIKSILENFGFDVYIGIRHRVYAIKRT